MIEQLVYEQRRFLCHVVEEMGNFKHMHNEIELLYLCKGQAKAHYNGQEYPLKQGDFMLVFPNSVHSFMVEQEVEYLLSIFDKNYFPPFIRTFSEFTVSEPPIVPLSSLHEEQMFCVNQLVNRKELWTKGTVTMGYLMIIVENILKNLPLEPCLQDQQGDWLYRAFAYLNNNYTQSINLEKMSQELGISKYHLSRNFNSCAGCSISQYTNRLRLIMAKDMLAHTDLQVTEVAFASGFESLTTFARVFKAAGLENPKKYRAQQLLLKPQ